jgi:hypothetical protein
VALLTTHVELEDERPGVFRQTINMRAIGYRSFGTLQRIASDWQHQAEDGNWVGAAPLQVLSALDGGRRMHPTREPDKWIELGAPRVKIGGVWTKVNLGTPTRVGNRLTWTSQNANAYIWHGGHMVKLAVLLKNGYVPEDGLIAWPVGIQGLTRQGATILNNGVPVLRLSPPHVEDLDNPGDERPIAFQFTNISGQPYMMMTLPSLAGMSQPLIDPTLTLQPDATDGVDTRMDSNTPTNNFGTNASLFVGESNTAVNTIRTLIKFDLSSLPGSASITAATFSMRVSLDRSDNDRTFRVFRQKRDWVESQATWTIWKTSNNWASLGGFDAADCEQTEIGSRAFTATEAVGFKDFPLTPTTKAALDLGNGWLVKADTESDDAYVFDSSDAATAANRPKLVIIYTEAAGNSFFRAPWWGRFH